MFDTIRQRASTGKNENNEEYFDAKSTWVCRLGSVKKDIGSDLGDAGDARVNEMASYEKLSLGDALNTTSDPRQRRIRFLNVDEASETIEQRIVAYCTRLDSLNENQMNTVKDVFLEYKSVFSELPGCTDAYEHHITPLQEKQYIKKSYPVPISQRVAVNSEIQRMLNMGIIERSESPYCNPLRIVEKKSGEVRVCLDARFLNRVISSDNECPPRIEDIIQHHEGIQYMSTTDLISGYWQVRLTKESRKFTAFLHQGTLYHFIRVPFGFKIAGNGFIRALSLAIGVQLSDVITCYIDDILVRSRSFDQHI